MKPAHRFLLCFFLSSTAVLGAIATLTIKSLFFDAAFTHQKLYNYQIQKLEQETNPTIIFVGDSSLGNALDAKLFSQLSQQKALNLSLTGAYGYAGSFNMAKRALQSKTVKTVVIVQTLDILQRPTSYEGFLYTMNGYTDLQSLQPLEIMWVDNAFLNVIFSTSNLEKSWNNLWNPTPRRIWTELQTRDYVDQQPRKFLEDNPKPIQGNINLDEFRFLTKLRDLCRQQQVQLIYAHGPLWKTVQKSSQPYIRQVNQAIASRKIKVIPQVIEVANADVGDEWDHVYLPTKPYYTQKYFQLLKPHLESKTNLRK